MSTYYFILLGLLLTSSFACGQFVLDAGHVLSFSYRILPGTPPCTPAPTGSSNSAMVALVLDAESLASGSTFRMEILSGTTSEPVASAVWSGSNSPLTLSYAAPGFNPGGVRLTGLTGSVSITSIALPWSQGELSVLRPHQWQICYFDGAPILPGVHLFVQEASPSKAKLRWTTNAISYRLEASDDLRAGSWSEVTNPPVVIGSYLVVTVDSPTGQRFYRLKKP